MNRKTNFIPLRSTNIKKQVTRFNYIPHTTKEYPFSKWRYVYDHSLRNLYSILIDCINMNYDLDIKWENFFEDFCLLIYNRSSKFIFKDDLLEIREKEYQECRE